MANLLTIEDLCSKLNIGRSYAYNLIKENKIASGKIGKRIVITPEALEKYINQITSSKEK